MAHAENKSQTDGARRFTMPLYLIYIYFRGWPASPASVPKPQTISSYASPGKIDSRSECDISNER